MTTTKYKSNQTKNRKQELPMLGSECEIEERDGPTYVELLKQRRDKKSYDKFKLKVAEGYFEN